MADTVIRVDGLGKMYRIGAARQKGDGLRHALEDGVRRLGQRLKGRYAPAPEKQDFWALKDVGFEVKRGECVGVIGRNGAGKSTLLKVLSRITEPTTGEVRLRGRVGSLLEVGTGFHPELTGRENIYLNGAILGMPRQEIGRKFDEIVAFSEVETFLDTPVKHYSSGMYTRLAFSVAAHLEPEILIVDEVLAVGDVQFQQKCLGKMGEVAKGGRTVLFVSHNMAAIEQLTSRCVVLNKGRLESEGTPRDSIARYLETVAEADSDENVELHPRKHPDLRQDIKFIQVRVDHANRMLASDEPLKFKIGLRTNTHVPEFRLSATIFRLDGTPVGSWFSNTLPGMDKCVSAEYLVELTDHALAPGKYYVGIATGRGDHRTGHIDYDIILQVLHFEVRPTAGEGGMVGHWASAWGAIIFKAPVITRMS